MAALLQLSFSWEKLADLRYVLFQEFGFFTMNECSVVANKQRVLSGKLVNHGFWTAYGGDYISDASANMSMCKVFSKINNNINV